MRLFLIALLAMITVPSFAQTADKMGTDQNVKIRAYLEPEGDVYIGQLVRLWIEVTSASQFASAPSYPDLDLSGAIAILPDQFGVNFSDTSQGKSLIGQRQRFAIIPQRAGTIRIPPVTVRLSITRDDQDPLRISLSTEALDLVVTRPPGTEKLKHIVTTENLLVEERFDRDGKDFKVGDAITRTIVLQAKDTFALALPAVEFQPIAGTRLYPAQPVLSDNVYRGQYSGQRSDSASYVLEKKGKIDLPSITIQWWNPQSLTLQSHVLPGVSYTVAENPNVVRPIGVDVEKPQLVQKLKAMVVFAFVWLKDHIILLSLAAIGLYLLALIWRQFGMAAIGKIKAWRRARLKSEGRYFRDLRKACLWGDEANLARTFWRWIDSQSPDFQVNTLLNMGLRSPNQNDESYLEWLERSRYGREQIGSVNRFQFYRLISRQRRALKVRRSARPTLLHSQLNPGKSS